MNTVEMAHGSGGQAMQQLINQLFMEAFNNPWLAEQEDQARIELATLTAQGDRLAFAQRLLSGRLALMEKSRAGLDALECGSWKGRDIERLRDSLAANAAELAAHHSAGSGLDATLEGVIRTLEAADAVIHAEKLSLSLDAMNIVVPPGSPDAAIVPLLEFSTATPGSSRRVAFLASVPRHAVAERKLDLAAGMRLL